MEVRKRKLQCERDILTNHNSGNDDGGHSSTKLHPT